ncbi:hypothetical protein CSOJ01_11276 [Colletotrichum sojae]|uniref:Uncharacterized protein n=1 Tax=Colletotrichum sojae TaxID=2175907 RepID=A0A8H6IXW8_9PEZI|nr:hypothetical protein CSOJ01_11276 [Colletotrichum sojae]
MSGFEVAGIVLGSIPLIISALEHYNKDIATVGTWRRYKTVLGQLKRNLETELVGFQDVCDKLLLGLVPKSQIDSMVSERLDPAWLDPGLQDKIKARLHRSFDVFEGRVKDIESAIDEMIEKLDLQPGGKVRWQEASAIVREFKRATFTLERSEYEELLATIKEGVSSVESMVDRNVKMEPERKRRSQGRLIRIAREVYVSVYRALVSGLQCSCSHRLHLGLASRSVDLPHGEADEGVIQRLSFSPGGHLRDYR